MKALVLVDIQDGLKNTGEGYYGRERNNLHAEQNAARLLEKYRKENLPIYFVKHNSIHETSPLFPGKVTNEIQQVVRPQGDEPVFEKNVNSAFIGTQFEERLRKDGIDQLIIVGLTTDHCISSTVRMASNLGFDTTVVSDATATFDRIGINGEHLSAQLMHELALASLNEEFARVVNTDDLLEA